MTNPFIATAITPAQAVLLARLEDSDVLNVLEEDLTDPHQPWIALEVGELMLTVNLDRATDVVFLRTHGNVIVYQCNVAAGWENRVYDFLLSLSLQDVGLAA